MGSVLWTQRSYCLWGRSALCCLLTLQLLPLSVFLCPSCWLGPPSVFWWNKEEPVSRFDLCWWNRKEPVSRNTSFGNSETKSSPWPSSHYLRTALMSTPMLYLIILTCKILTNYLQGNHLLALLATLIQDIFTCRFITLYLQTFDCIAHMQPHFS